MYICMSAHPRSLKHYKSCWFTIESMQPNLDHRSDHRVWLPCILRRVSSTHTQGKMVQFSLSKPWPPQCLANEPQLTRGFFSWARNVLELCCLDWLYLHWKFQSTFCFFKMCWWLTGLSRPYDASQPQLHVSYSTLKQHLKRYHISFLFNGISFGNQSISSVVFHVTITDIHKLFPRFLLYMLFFWL